MTATDRAGDNVAPRSGGHLLVDQLLRHGTRMAFCVPGESYLEVLDGLHDAGGRITLVNARQEAGAANMAEAYGKLTGQPGICMVTRGPGACQAAVGVHTAAQDSTPMIMLIGQVGRDMLDREAFQEIDYRAMFGTVAKWVAQVDRADRIPEYMARAFHTALSGRPGPVVLALPEDMLLDHVRVPDAAGFAVVAPAPAPDGLARLRALLEAAQRPLLLVGGPGWSDAACAQIQRFAEANGLPAACSFRRQDVFDNRSDCFVGDLGLSGPPSLVQRMKEADLILAVGARLGEITSQGYSLLDLPVSRQHLVHVHPDPNEPGKVFTPTLALASSVHAFAAAVAECRWVDPSRWQEWRAAARADFLAASTPPLPVAEGAPDLDPAQVMAELRQQLPADAIVCLDAGNHTGWPQRYLLYGRPGRQLGPTSGAMGYGVPAAVAASLAHPERTVICGVGDGGFMMSGLELATAVQHGGRPIVLVFNNGMYGTIRMHQEREHPGRVVGTDLANPDFAAMARAMGAHGERVSRTADFLPAFTRAREAGRAALIELVVDPELVSTRLTMSALRARAKR